jgi:hypothetical protein
VERFAVAPLGAQKMNDFYATVMGQPTIARATGTAAGAGDNTVVAAPAAGYKLIVLYAKAQNESATATTATFKYGTTTVARGLLAQYGVLERDYGLYPLELPAATAFLLNLSGANSHGYMVETVTVPA